MKVEIFTSADGHDLVVNQKDQYRQLSETDSIINVVDDMINNRYPKAAKRLADRYSDQFSRVRRFCKCNFGKNDSIPDIDGEHMNLEFVHCPLRGECEDENVICNPELSTGLTVRETQVVVEFAKGKLAKEVAYMFQITQRTAEAHKRNIYAKIGINSIGELSAWAHNNHLIH